MTYLKKQLTREKLITSVTKGFKKYGFEGVGVDVLANEAGLTSGAFYAHLGSKSAAFKLVLMNGLDQLVETVPTYQHEFGVDWVKEFSKFYLCHTHINDLESGCVMATLTLDIIRQRKFRDRKFQQKIDHIIALIAQGLAGNDQKEKHGRAWSYMSILVGGLTFLRTINDEDTQAYTAKSIIDSACQVAGKVKQSFRA